MRPRRVVVIAYPDVQSLDVAGPVEVFASVPGAYALTLATPGGGPVRSTSGLTFSADAAVESLRGPVDTLVVAGGHGTRAAVADPALIGAVARLARSARRVAGVCSGAFLLAEAGLLDGRRATTHWSACAALARAYPTVDVDPDPIYVRDGKVWTSAGVTAGMDLALALVEEDHGRDAALAVARRLVLFLRRPGGQSQFSAQLAAQTAEREGLRAVQHWIAEHPGEDLAVTRLADRAGMSVRHFARAFRQQVGVTPARYVEQVRLEAARRLLEDTDEGVEAVARRCGFGTAETMRRSFLRALRLSPAEYRRRFAAASA